MKQLRLFNIGREKKKKKEGEKKGVCVTDKCFNNIFRQEL